jgi:hypothetical protein
MSLYSSNYLRNLARNTITAVRDRYITESRNQTAQFDIFLSHSYLDREEVEGIYLELTSKGYGVYVDWIVDPQLSRTNVTKETAEKIRNRMRMSRSLLLAVSTNAQMSKWMPWELGYVDGRSGQCAIFPVSPEVNPPNILVRSEYLLLYPYVKLAEIDYRKDLYITESANNYTSMREFVKTQSKPSYKTKNIDLL